MTFGITAGTPTASGFASGAPAPAPAPGFGLIAAISTAPGFALGVPAPAAPGFSTSGLLLKPSRDAFNEFIQWRFGGVDLGAPTVQVIDFTGPSDVLEVTRGVGENAHVLTVRVTRQFLYFTSWLYPVDGDNAEVGVSSYPTFGSLIVWPIESVNVVSTIPAFGTLTLALNQYADQLPEAVNVTSTIPNTGTLVTVLNQYTFQLPEQVDVVSTIPITGTCVVILVSYTFQLPEQVDVVSTIPLTGTLV
jgi:hypothetical protein